MENSVFLWGAIAILALLYILYARIIGRRNGALEALSGIDVQLKKRSDLIPNILIIAKKFMEHEMALLSEITSLRESVDRGYDRKQPDAVISHFDAAEQLAEKVGSLMVKVEAYPDLKSQETMVQAQQSYNEVEAQISAARRFYNTSVSELNNSVQIFPGNMLARMVGVSAMPFYQADEQSRSPVNAAEILQ